MTTILVHRFESKSGNVVLPVQLLKAKSVKLIHLYVDNLPPTDKLIVVVCDDLQTKSKCYLNGSVLSIVGTFPTSPTSSSRNVTSIEMCSIHSIRNLNFQFYTDTGKLLDTLVNPITLELEFNLI